MISIMALGKLPTRRFAKTGFDRDKPREKRTPARLTRPNGKEASVVPASTLQPARTYATNKEAQVSGEQPPIKLSTGGCSATAAAPR